MRSRKRKIALAVVSAEVVVGIVGGGLLGIHAASASPAAPTSQARYGSLVLDIGQTSFPWSVGLAERFDGCEAHVSGVPSSVVVHKSSGSDVRMSFDRAWHVTHDATHRDDVFVEGQCR